MTIKQTALTGVALFVVFVVVGVWSGWLFSGSDERTPAAAVSLDEVLAQPIVDVLESFRDTTDDAVIDSLIAATVVDREVTTERGVLYCQAASISLSFDEAVALLDEDAGVAESVEPVLWVQAHVQARCPLQVERLAGT